MARKKENKRSDGYYEYKCIVSRKFDGTPVYKSFYSKKSKANARLKADKYKEELLRKQDEPEMILFEDWAQTFLKHYKNKVRQNTYIYNYESIFENHLIPYFKGRLLKSIAKTDVESYIDFKLEKYATSTIAMHISKLSKCFNEAIDNKYLTYNPCSNIKKSFTTKEKRVYTQEETDYILEFCKDDKFGLYVHIILSYGMSKSEFLGIKVEDVDFENLTISINKSITAKNKYSGKHTVSKTKNKYRNRVIAIKKETADFIQSTVSEGFLFTRSDDVPNPQVFTDGFKAFMKRMQRHYKSMGIEIPMLNIHELRHTRASLWVNQGKNLFAIAEMLGWYDLTMLRKIYGHPDIMQLRKELDL